MPASSGHTGTVIVPPAIGLDGSTGIPCWAGHTPRNWWWSVFPTNLLDPGDVQRLPSFLTTGMGATVCRSVLPTTATGVYAHRKRAGAARTCPRRSAVDASAALGSRDSPERV